ncbi:hypothetical protein BDV39DRAFT_27750 [Aspergillus sergii]|uniref:Uncharacterized protein n=1 Tax=Aspergillus sergii TaxID=1034303 RepID=A0A5N6XB64_9EURO|nr:hypothetical protein BDV39DRAFT_27750 [Aspergillus sergii]
MPPWIWTLQKPIAIHPKYIASEPTSFHVKKHTYSLSKADFTISTCTKDLYRKPNLTKLFPVRGHWLSKHLRRDFCDADGYPPLPDVQ